MQKVAVLVFDITQKFGTERAVCNLASALVPYGYDVSIVSAAAPGPVHFDLPEGVHVQFLDVYHRSGKLKRILQYGQIIAGLRKLVRQEKYDFVLGTTHALNTLLWFVPAGRIACEHMNYEACRGRISRLIRKMVYPRLDATVMLTGRDAVKYTFIAPEKRFVIPNTLPVPFLKAAVSPQTGKRAIALGRLTEQKGFDILLEIAVRMKAQNPGWRVDIFGSGEDEAALKKQAAELGVDDFVFIHPPTTDPAGELSRSDIYLLTSRYEGFGLVLIEAQACGVPAVSFDCTEGPAEIIHEGKDGFLVPPGDLEMFAERFTRLAGDDALRKAFALEAKRSSAAYLPEKVGSLWDALFTELTRRKNRG